MAAYAPVVERLKFTFFHWITFIIMGTNTDDPCRGRAADRWCLASRSTDGLNERAILRISSRFSALTVIVLNINAESVRTKQRGKRKMPTMILRKDMARIEHAMANQRRTGKPTLRLTNRCVEASSPCRTPLNRNLRLVPKPFTADDEIQLLRRTGHGSFVAVKYVRPR